MHLFFEFDTKKEKNFNKTVANFANTVQMSSQKFPTVDSSDQNSSESLAFGPKIDGKIITMKKNLSLPKMKTLKSLGLQEDLHPRNSLE